MAIINAFLASTIGVAQGRSVDSGNGFLQEWFRSAISFQRAHVALYILETIDPYVSSTPGHSYSRQPVTYAGLQFTSSSAHFFEETHSSVYKTIFTGHVTKPLSSVRFSSRKLYFSTENTKTVRTKYFWCSLPYCTNSGMQSYSISTYFTVGIKPPSSIRIIQTSSTSR